VVAPLGQRRFVNVPLPRATAAVRHTPSPSKASRARTIHVAMDVAAGGAPLAPLAPRHLETFNQRAAALLAAAGSGTQPREWLPATPSLRNSANTMLVPATGFEPARPYGQGILRPVPAVRERPLMSTSGVFLRNRIRDLPMLSALFRGVLQPTCSHHRCRALCRITASRPPRIRGHLQHRSAAPSPQLMDCQIQCWDIFHKMRRSGKHRDMKLFFCWSPSHKPASSCWWSQLPAERP